MKERVARRIRESRLLEPGDRVAVAVSGGPDSVALLSLLTELADELLLTLSVCHYNHRWRGAEADADEEFTRALAERFGLPFDARRRPDDGTSAASSGLEARGRRLRYEYFDDLIREGFCDKTATGHNRDDQAETVLFRMLRGAGSAGLAAIRPSLASRVVRPLLDLSREDVLAYLRLRGLRWREDRSNADRRFARNRLRHDLIPELERVWNPRLRETLARLAEQQLDEEAYWEGVVDRHWSMTRREGEAIVFAAEPFEALHRAARRRLLRRAAREMGATLDFDHVERLLRAASSERPDGAATVPGVELRRSVGLIRVAPAKGRAKSSTGQEDWARELTPPSEVELPGGRGTLRFEIETSNPKTRRYNKPDWSALDWSRLPRPLVLRSWRAGDRIELPGRGLRKLKGLWKEAGAPTWERSGWPVLAAARGGDLIWAFGFGAARRFEAGPDAPSVLIIQDARAVKNESRRTEQCV